MWNKTRHNMNRTSMCKYLVHKHHSHSNSFILAKQGIFKSQIRSRSVLSAHWHSLLTLPSKSKPIPLWQSGCPHWTWVVSKSWCSVEKSRALYMQYINLVCGYYLNVWMALCSKNNNNNYLFSFWEANGSVCVWLWNFQ